MERLRERFVGIVNLGIGTRNREHGVSLAAALAMHSLVTGSASALPGSLAGAMGVHAGPETPRHRFRYLDGVLFASPYRRPPIPCFPVEL